MRTACMLAVLMACHVAARVARPAEVESPKVDATTKSADGVMVLRIQPDGNVEPKGSIPADIRQGTIVVVGPDGVAHTQPFSIDGGVPGLRFDIVTSLEAAGAVLLEQDRARLMLAFQPVPPVPPVSSVAPPVSAFDATSGKLDRILERLEKLEQDVAAIKSPKGSD